MESVVGLRQIPEWTQVSLDSTVRCFLKYRRMKRHVQEGVCEVDFTDGNRISQAKKDLSASEVLLRAGDAFQVLSHPSRLRVLEALRGRELCVCDLSEVLELSMSATSQVLRDLRTLGAVRYRAQGRLAYYSLGDRFWSKLARTVIGRIGGDMVAVARATGTEGKLVRR